MTAAWRLDVNGRQLPASTWLSRGGISTTSTFEFRVPKGVDTGLRVGDPARVAVWRWGDDPWWRRLWYRLRPPKPYYTGFYVVEVIEPRYIETVVKMVDAMVLLDHGVV